MQKNGPPYIIGNFSGSSVWQVV